MVQWLELRDFTAKGLGSIPGRRTRIPQAVWRCHKTKQNKTKTKQNKKKLIQSHISLYFVFQVKNLFTSQEINMNEHLQTLETDLTVTWHNWA